MNTPYMTEVRISVLKQIANAVLKNLDDWFLVDAFELTDKNRASINELVTEYEKNNKL
ncbi:MAG: hypothetical protein PUJ82_13915 [Spirochaetales bacterium]|nr:hypothetical protein [Spirochaetales bacterium]MDY5914627.1 hypothetical protein [Treponema sp.]